MQNAVFHQCDVQRPSSDKLSQESMLMLYCAHVHKQVTHAICNGFVDRNELTDKKPLRHRKRATSKRFKIRCIIVYRTVFAAA
jgi:hypothetical protein